MIDFFKEKVILCTGGSGSWGNELATQLLEKNPKKIIIFSRGELAQVNMERKFQNPKLEFIIGDVRDADAVDRLFHSRKIDYVFHPNGFTNHHWNGVTCLQMAKVFEFIMVNNIYWSGVRHIFSPEIVNKYELVQMVSDAHNLNIQVIPIDADIPCDRSLSTIYNDIDFNIPPLKEQIEEQFNYFNII